MKFKSGRTFFLILSSVSIIYTAGCNDIPADSAPADQTIIETPVDNSNNHHDKEQNDKNKLETIIVEPAELILGSDMKKQLVVTVKGKSEQTIADVDSVKFTSSNPEAATVDANGIVHVSANAVTGNTAIISISYKGLSAESLLTVKNLLENTVTAGANGIAVVTNPKALDVVVNKQRSLPADFIPPHLVEPDVPFSFSGQSEKKLLQKVAADALEKLFQAAKKDNITLYAVSGYRSYATQKSIYNSNVARQGEAEASRFSARPGHSEHQTGLTMDVTGKDPNCLLEQCFENTAEGKWIAENAAKFGFIIRYPKDKEDITGYAFEPWHIRYVGVELAQEINELDTTMEQYFSEAIPVSSR